MYTWHYTTFHDVQYTVVFCNEIYALHYTFLYAVQYTFVFSKEMYTWRYTTFHDIHYTVVFCNEIYTLHYTLIYVVQYTFVLSKEMYTCHYTTLNNLQYTIVFSKEKYTWHYTALHVLQYKIKYVIRKCKRKTILLYAVYQIASLQLLTWQTIHYCTQKHNRWFHQLVWVQSPWRETPRNWCKRQEHQRTKYNT